MHIFKNDLCFHFGCINLLENSEILILHIKHMPLVSPHFHSIYRNQIVWFN